MREERPRREEGLSGLGAVLGLAGLLVVLLIGGVIVAATLSPNSSTTTTTTGPSTPRRRPPLPRRWPRHRRPPRWPPAGWTRRPPGRGRGLRRRPGHQPRSGRPVVRRHLPRRLRAPDRGRLPRALPQDRPEHPVLRAPVRLGRPRLGRAAGPLQRRLRRRQRRHRRCGLRPGGR